MCVEGGGRRRLKGAGEREKGTGELIHLFQTLCVGEGGGGRGEPHWEGDSVISNCIENEKSSQCFHFGQLFILSSVV